MFFVQVFDVFVQAGLGRAENGLFTATLKTSPSIGRYRSLMGHKDNRAIGLKTHLGIRRFVLIPVLNLADLSSGSATPALIITGKPTASDAENELIRLTS